MSFGVPERGDHPWTLPEEPSRKIIRQAVDLGINFFDTANAYSDGTSEEIVGRALKDFTRREEVVIATKVFFPMTPDPNGGGLSRKAIFTAIDASLRRLGTDYVDLYQIHRWDYSTPDRRDSRGLARGGEDAAKPATSAPPRCSPGNSAKPCTSHGAGAGRRSSPCKTTTTCSTEKRSAK